MDPYCTLIVYLSFGDIRLPFGNVRLPLGNVRLEVGELHGLIRVLGVPRVVSRWIWRRLLFLTFTLTFRRMILVTLTLRLVLVLHQVHSVHEHPRLDPHPHTGSSTPLHTLDRKHPCLNISILTSIKASVSIGQLHTYILYYNKQISLHQNHWQQC